MQLLSPQLQIGKSPPFFILHSWRKRLLLCRPDGSFPQPMAAVPEGPKATPATGSFGEFKLLHKNINQNAPAPTRRGAEHNIQELWLL
jgi:hypothetical protein